MDEILSLYKCAMVLKVRRVLRMISAGKNDCKKGQYMKICVVDNEGLVQSVLKIC